MKKFIEEQIQEIQEIVKDDEVILGLSGGVDSSVAAALISKAIGKKLTCIFVDTGLLRKDEAKKVMDKYTKLFDMNIKLIDASKQFYSALKGISDPEEKRKIIGREFINVFNKEAGNLKNAKFLAQGTIYPDVIESSSKGHTSKTIKSHHNVGGLPDELNFKLIEPLRTLFKDEVRKIGLELGLEESLINRHPFPGPGLGIRIIGEISEEKANILREVDDIFISMLIEKKLYNKVSQAFATILPVKTVGVMGDNRTYDYLVALRSVNTVDFMTATSTHLPSDFLDDVVNKIINKSIEINIPIMSAAMDTVTESKMAIKLAQLGSIGVIHKNLTIEQQAKEVELVKNFKIDLKEFPTATIDNKGKLRTCAAVGVNQDSLERVKSLISAGVDVLIVDSAHGDSEGIIKTVKEIKKLYPNQQLIAGNICTVSGAKNLIAAGVDGVKVGIGPGSICTTRVIAGVGVPQITAINDVYNYLKDTDITLIADGGIKLSGDIVKAIAAGANLVMLGSMLAGTDEAPGQIIEVNGRQFKSYQGMGSLSAMKRGSSDRYFQNGSKKLVPEGIEALIKYKGNVEDVIYQLIGGLRSGMGYTGSSTIDDLIKNGQFVRISTSGLIESHPHDVLMEKDSPNYKKNI
ncbi:hypothetical protein FQR65_LT16605 [Abscondita terminalis]|nr:hypothetical protein FQR65_LT16605 [Abscondita terminalis]